MNPRLAKLISVLHDLVEELDKSKDEVEHEDLFETFRDVLTLCEPRDEAIQRIHYSPLQLIGAQIAANLGLFQLVATSPEPVSIVDSLAVSTDAELQLLRRILKYLASVSMVREISEDKYGPTNLTKAFSDPKIQSELFHQHDLIGRVFQNLPKNPVDDSHTAFLDKYPVNDHFKGSIPETPLFVDVGGGVGIQSVELKKKLSTNVHGRIIVQNQPAVIAQASHMDGVEVMNYDFWKAQPVKGARIYYFRYIMHDYPDHKAVTILRNTVSAMSSESVVIIDEMIMSEEEAHLRATKMDILLMAYLAGAKRTRPQWEALLNDAGLDIVEVRVYTEDVRDSVIVAKPK